MIETSKYFDNWNKLMREKIEESGRRARIINSLIEVIESPNIPSREVYARLATAKKEVLDAIQKTRKTPGQTWLGRGAIDDSPGKRFMGANYPEGYRKGDETE